MKKLSLTLSIILIAASLSAQRTIIHAGTLIDGVSKKAVSEKSIIVEGKSITSIENGYVSAQNGDQVIDLKNYTVMPGWIDMHVHMEGESSPDRYIRTFTDNPADKAFMSVDISRRTLMAGFTTVRDVGGSGVNVSLREAIAKGIIDGPRIFTSEKGLSITGGHGDPTNGYRDDLMGNPGPKEGVVNGVDDARKAVRQRYKNGADLIKITATGGVLSVAKDGKGAHFQEAEIKAIVEAATDLGFHVAAHAHGDEGMQRAVANGVKTIEHGTYMSDETMDLMIEKNAFLVPTITAGMEVAENAKKPGYYPKVVADKARVIGPKIQGTFTRAYKKGVPIAFGTDAGVFKHGENAREFTYMVEGGMPAIEAIISATSVPAGLLGMGDQIGSLKEGYLADIVAVPGNPLENIEVMKDVKFVMKEGKIYKN
ncbi:Imidazolonepropionase [Ekhidna lutea]|uniref:Imidazolonepropionase n=1 Tax=Ekhidna lutea TaxID=447679 RepID=A0A239J1S9_EKHLU|nr:amidohydrolase family protein [Ekhidna lutea]SNS99418.1 Imidazolonepropionase [Ekhidna lutea]